MKSLAFLVLVACFAFASVAADPLAAFEQGNKAYEQKEFKQAISAYQEVLKSGKTSAALHFNLANAHFRAGDIGRAIAHYRKAQRLAPRDNAIASNLQFAREKLDPQNAEAAQFGEWTRKVRLGEALTVTAVLLWTWFGLLTLQQVRRNLVPKLSMPTTLSAIAALVAIACSVLIYRDHAQSSAVVTVPETAARYGPLEESQTAFSIRSGAELIVTDRQRDWAEIRDQAGRTGWVPLSALELI